MGVNAVEGVRMRRCWAGEVLNGRMNIRSKVSEYEVMWDSPYLVSRK